MGFLWEKGSGIPTFCIITVRPFADATAPEAGAADHQLQAVHREVVGPHHAGRPDAEGDGSCSLSADRQEHQREVRLKSHEFWE